MLKFVKCVDNFVNIVAKIGWIAGLLESIKAKVGGSGALHQ